MLRVTLAPTQQSELERFRDTAERPYLREKAAAILKVASGHSATQVAEHLLLRPRTPYRVRGWIRRYQQEGVGGLYHRRRGGGRPPGSKDRVPRKRISRSQVAADEDPHGIRAAMSGPPMVRSRWSLASIRQAVPVLRCYSLPGVWNWLRRLGIRLRRGREYIHSPDPDYVAKEHRIMQALKEARASNGKVVLVYADEMSYYLQPTVSNDYSLPAIQPLARRSTRANTARRIVGGLDAVTGRVIQRQAWKIGVSEFTSFLQDLREAYSDTERLYLVLDNWPSVHRHTSVRDKARELGITILFLPTYAPWLNPIEKLWRWLRQQVLHLHCFAHDPPRLQLEVHSFINRFADGRSQCCQALLRYVGLAPEKKTITLSC